MSLSRYNEDADLEKAFEQIRMIKEKYMHLWPGPCKKEGLEDSTSEIDKRTQAEEKVESLGAQDSLKASFDDDDELESEADSARGQCSKVKSKKEIEKT